MQRDARWNSDGDAGGKGGDARGIFSHGTWWAQAGCNQEGRAPVLNTGFSLQMQAGNSAQRSCKVCIAGEPDETA